jgi:hypothetical protein
VPCYWRFGPPVGFTNLQQGIITKKRFTLAIEHAQVVTRLIFHISENMELFHLSKPVII